MADAVLQQWHVQSFGKTIRPRILGVILCFGIWRETDLASCAFKPLAAIHLVSWTDVQASIMPIFHPVWAVLTEALTLWRMWRAFRRSRHIPKIPVTKSPAHSVVARRDCKSEHLFLPVDTGKSNYFAAFSMTSSRPLFSQFGALRRYWPTWNRRIQITLATTAFAEYNAGSFLK